MVACQFIVALSVDEASGRLTSSWLPQPAALLSMAAPYFREVLTANTSTSSSSTTTAADSSTLALPNTAVDVRIIPCAYVAHAAQSASSAMRYYLDERSGEPSAITQLPLQQRPPQSLVHTHPSSNEQQADDDGCLSAVGCIAQCFVTRPSQQHGGK